jgi:hypothetical protein
MPKNTRVAGHELQSEGAAFTPNPGGRRFNPVRVSSNTVSGVGSAWCSCGKLSPVLTSGGARKKWHADHKAEKRDEQAGASAITEAPLTDETIDDVITQMLFNEGHGDRQLWQSQRKSAGERIGSKPETPSFNAGYRAALERLASSLPTTSASTGATPSPAVRFVELLAAGATASR